MSKYKAIGTVGTMFGSWPQFFARSYKDLMTYNNRYLVDPGEYIKEADASVSWHSSGRNELVEKAEGEWLFSLDCDHVYAPDLLDRLLREMRLSGASVVSGLYLNKHPGSGHVPVALVPNQKTGQLDQLVSWPKNCRHLPVATVGGGCLLVKTEVFRKIMSHYKEKPFDLLPGLSEDYSFCKRCTDLGIPIILCPQVECHHTVNHVLSAKDFNFEK